MRIAVGFVVSVLAASLTSAQTATAVRPTPRTADGKPDLTGVYQASTRKGAWDAEAPGDQPGVAGPRSPGIVQGTAPSEAIPFTPEARVKAQEILNRRSVDDPTGFCLPVPSPRLTNVGLFPIQFVQTPTHLIIMYEYLWLFRVIPLDGRGHPDDMEPTFLGDSVGRWDGNTLVVDVVGFKPGSWLLGGLVASDALHLTERYTRVDRDQINYEVTIEDPRVLTKPFAQRSTLMLREGTRLREYSCVENNMDPKVYERLLANPSLFLRNPEKPQ